MATTYLTRTLGSGNKDKWTWSAWVKKHSNGSILPLFHADDGSTNYYTHISFHDTDQLFFQAEDGIRDLVRSRGLGDVYKRQFCSRYNTS